MILWNPTQLAPNMKLLSACKRLGKHNTILSSHLARNIMFTKLSSLMLLRKRIAAHLRTHMKHPSTLCGQNAEFYMLKQVVHI
jgi:hypothetical protein